MKKLITIFSAAFLMFSSTTISNASFTDYNLEIDLVTGQTEMLSGDQNYLDLSLKVTGAQTTFTDVEVIIKSDSKEIVEFDIDSLKQISLNVFDSIEMVDGALVMKASKLASGNYFEWPVRFSTKNGLTKDQTQISFTVQFKSNELVKNVKNASDSVLVRSSSPLKINKSYLGMSLDMKESKGLYFGSKSYWLTRAIIDSKDTGQEYIKEGSKIKIVETYHENLVYSGMHSGPEPVVDLSARTLTWEFDAPSYDDQSSQFDNLWKQELIVIYDTIPDPKNGIVYANIGVDVSLNFTNISDVVSYDESNAYISLYPGKSDIPNLVGSWNVFGHWGALDGYGNHGFASTADMDVQPTVYPWGTLSFAHRVSAMYSGMYDGYKAYMYNYLIDDYLEFESLSLPSEWVDFPNSSNPSKPLVDYPTYDLYFLNKKIELNAEGFSASEIINKNLIDDDDIVAVLRYGIDFQHGDTITREQVLAQKGLPEDTHIAQVRYNFTYAPAGMFSLTGLNGSNMFVYEFKINEDWEKSTAYDASQDRTKLMNEITILAVPPENPVHMKQNIIAEIWDFRSDTINGINKCSDKQIPGQGWWEENNVWLSCMYLRNTRYGTTEGKAIPNGFGATNYWGVNDYRTAYVTNDPIDNSPTVSNSVALLDQYHGEIYAGHNTLELNVKNHEDISIGSIDKERLVSYLMVPNSVSLDLSSFKVLNSAGTYLNVTMEKMTKQVGIYDFYLIEWNNGIIAPDQSLIVQVDVDISDKYQDLRMSILSDIPNDRFEILNVTNPKITDTIISKDTHDLTGKGAEYELIQSGNNYQLISDYYVKTLKTVKGNLDSMYTSFGKMTLDGSVDFKLEFQNKEGKEITSFVIMDILPSISDLGITDGVSRGSEFGLVLEGSINVPNKFNVYYSTQKNPTRAILNDSLTKVGFDEITDPVDAVDADWTLAEDVIDWNEIHSFVISLKEGQTLAEDEITEISFSTKVDPENYNFLANEANEVVAWNSFAFTVNGKPAVEPLQVGVTLTKEEVIPELTSVNVKKEWIGGPTKRPSVTVVLLANGEEVDRVILDGSEGWEHTWSELPKVSAEGDDILYSVDEIDVPKGYEKSIEGSIITNRFVEEPVDPPVDPELPPTGFSYNVIQPYALIIVGITLLYISSKRRNQNS